MNYRIGCETNTQFDEARGADDAVAAEIGVFRFTQIDWAWFEPDHPTGPTHGGGPWEHTYVPPEDEPEYTENKGWRLALDNSIEYAADNNMQVCLVIRNPPAWAAISRVAGCGCIAPEFYQFFAEFVDYIATRYEGAPWNVTTIEIWNEPDHMTPDSEVGGWSGIARCKEFVKLMKAVYTYVKPLHPDMNIINGGVWWEAKSDILYDDEWVKTFIEGWWENGVYESGMRYIDKFAFHAYERYDGGAKLWRHHDRAARTLYRHRIALIRSHMARYYVNDGVTPSNMPIVMNEGGVISGVNTTVAGYWGTAFPRVQKYFIAYMLAQMVGEPNCELYNWWRLCRTPDERNIVSALGIRYGDDDTPYTWEPNANWSAFEFGGPFVDDCTYVDTITSNSGTGVTTVIRLEHSSGSQRWLAINLTTGNVTYRVPPPETGWACTVYDVEGNTVATLAAEESDDIILTDPYRVIWLEYAEVS